MPLISSDLIKRITPTLMPAQPGTAYTQTASAPSAPSSGGSWWDSNPYDGPGDPQLAAPSAPSVQDGGGQYDLAAVSGEGFMRPWTEAFNAPTTEEMKADEAYQFRLGEGEQAIQRSAAAKGSLLSGSTLKDLTAWGQGLASEEFDKIYNRNLGEYRQAFDIYNTNTNNQFGRLSSLAGLGQNANSQNLSAGMNFGANAGNNMMGAGNAQAAGQAASGSAWGGFLGNLGNIASDAYAYRGGGGYSGIPYPTGMGPQTGLASPAGYARG